MTFFEYLAIAYSLVLSIAVTRVLGGLSAALFGEGRYWIHLAWVVHVLGSSLIVFWNFWMYRDIEWTLPRFMLVLASPALLLVQATQIIPVDPSKGQCGNRFAGNSNGINTLFRCRPCVGILAVDVDFEPIG